MLTEAQIYLFSFQNQCYNKTCVHTDKGWTASQENDEVLKSHSCHEFVPFYTFNLVLFLTWCL